MMNTRDVAPQRPGPGLSWGLASTVQLCQDLFGSDEYQANRAGLRAEELATALYQGILERAPDPSGLADTIAEIQAGRRAQRAAAMLDSPEFQSRFLP